MGLGAGERLERDNEVFLREVESVADLDPVGPQATRLNNGAAIVPDQFGNGLEPHWYLLRVFALVSVNVNSNVWIRLNKS